MGTVSFIAVFVGGILALLSPCAALLLPSFFTYAFTRPREVLARTVVFYLGLCLTLVPLGMGAAAASRLIYGQRTLLIEISGWVIIGFGLAMAAGIGFSVPGIGRLQGRYQARLGEAASWTPTLALGAVYGLAGFCSGPILGSVLTIAAAGQDPVRGALLLATYAAGMCVPLLALALIWRRGTWTGRAFLRGRAVRLGPVRTHSTSLIAGLLMVGIGVLFLRYDGTAGITGLFGFDTVDLEYAANRLVQNATRQVPNWALPALVALGAAAVLVRRWRHGAPDREPVPPPKERSGRA